MKIIMKKTEKKRILYYKNFIKKQIEEADKSGGVVGISGGIDSAVCMYLTCKAVGKQKTHPVYMPHQKNTRKWDNSIAELTTDLGIELKTYNLKNIIEEFKKLIGSRDQMEVGNFSARVRSAFLYQEAVITNSLVINTSNRSEELTGYFTKWGDEAGDISPLGNLYKKDVYSLGKSLGVPEKILKARPSAGFYENQTDETELGISYPVLDKVLIKIDQKREEDVEPELLKKVKFLIEKSEHKRNKPVTALRI